MPKVCSTQQSAALVCQHTAEYQLVVRGDEQHAFTPGIGHDLAVVLAVILV